MKNSKSKKRKKKIKTIDYIKYCLITIIGILAITGIYFFLIAEDDETKLTILEKQWIMQNKKTLIDINVPNNLNIIGDNGEGVVFDFISSVEKQTELKFNKKSYNYPEENSTLTGLSILAVNSTDSINETDILLTEDNYVLVSKNNEQIIDLNEIYNKKIGILSANEVIIKNNIGPSYKYTVYKNSADLINNLSKGKVDFVIAPRAYILKDIVSNKIYVNYSFTNLTNKIIMRMPKDKRLASIMSKHLEMFKAKDYLESYEKEFMDFYIENTEVTELDMSSLSSKVYKYGYVKNSNYNIKENKKLYGLAGEYVKVLENMANIEFEYKEYRTKEKLKEALKNGEVDLAFIDFDYKNESGKYTLNAFTPQMIALSKTNYSITDKTGLQNRKLYALENTYLASYLKDNYNSIVKEIKKVSSKLPEDAILVIDETDYYYHKDKLADYSLILKDEYESSYKFFVQKNEEVLYEFLNFIIMYIDQDDLKITSINNLVSNNNNEDGFKDIYLGVVLAIIIPVVILFSLIALTKARKHTKISRKEDVLKYNDMLTSLKNRNYLRAHIDEWDEVKISPRTIIIADLNNLKYVNDNYGQEEGNLLIKKAAAILINTQLEKSEIIRSDGNEFLIYLIGYNQTQVRTYINKLSKEFEKLPHGFGAAIGYSMIEDEIKTIDDAINEASIEMRMDKEQNYK